MKLFLTLIAFLCLTRTSVAQKPMELLKDETGKYTYYEVVPSNVPADSVKLRLGDFIAKVAKELRFQSDTQTGVLATGKMVINKNLSIASHPTGEIRYNFNFEQGANKYRFWLTDFEFIPYYKDRYGNFVPSTTVGKPLEVEVRKSAQEQWDDYKLQVAAYANIFADKLKRYLASQKNVVVKPEEKKVISKSW